MKSTRRWWRAALLFLLFALLIASGRAVETPIALPPAPARPDADCGPTRVYVGMWITDVSKIDSVAQQFSATMVLFLNWRDSRLAHAGPEVKQYPITEVWHPEWLMVNETGGTTHSLPEVVTVTPEGMVSYHQRISGTYAQGLDLSRFPFDQGTFRIHLVVAGHRPEEIEFAPAPNAVAAGMPDGAGIAPQLSQQDWRVLSTAAYALPYATSPALQVAGYAFEFKAERNTQHFIVKVIIPLIFIVMMSWSVFWVEPADTGSGMGVSVTAMLTLIAHRFALDNEVPKLSYVTRLDSFVLTSTLLVFLSLIEVLVTTRMVAAGRLPGARRVDLHARWVFPILFGAACLMIFTEI